MKKIKELFKNNIKLVIGIIIGGIVFGTIGVYAATTLLSQSVYYNNSTSGASSTNVQGAIDELYTRSNTWINPKNLSDYQFNFNKTILASSAGVCINRNGTVSCFKTNNWSVEKTHIQEVFSDISCDVYSSDVLCYASDFGCYVSANGSVDCSGQSDNSNCYVNTDGSFNCTRQLSSNIVTKMNSNETILATPEGITFKRNGNIYHISANNWAEEQTHIQEVFSDISCDVRSSVVNCDASDFHCNVYSNGDVYFNDQSDNSNCSVSSDGSVVCH